MHSETSGSADKALSDVAATLQTSLKKLESILKLCAKLFIILRYFFNLLHCKAFHVSKFRELQWQEQRWP
jgi:hypothetical protein